MKSPDLKRDFEKISKCRPPLRRAAYSDRTAWLMSILAELAYTRFDEEDESVLIDLAQELAGLGDPGDVARRLKDFKATIGCADRDGHVKLREILAAGGFELRGILFDAATDTQGFVAAHQTDGNCDMAVISFRGTQEAQDWMTNFNFDKDPVRKRSQDHPNLVGHVHRGFNQAFLSVERQIRNHLTGLSDVPLYITGHSLGGALAILATWYLSAGSLAACYTFGSPKVGDEGLTNHFRTPIYRIVNGADPVPFVPLKRLSRQGYRHYGFQRYLTICGPGANGSFPELRVEYGVSGLGRLGRFASRLMLGKAKRLDKYHNISLYRHKLREFAIRRLNEFPIQDDNLEG